MRTRNPDDGWPDLSTQRLQETLPEWLGLWLDGKSRLAEVRQLDPVSILASRLDRDHRQRLDRQAPSRLTTP